MNSDSPLIDSLSVPSLPPLTIHHFMLWTVVSAVMLTVLKTADWTGWVVDSSCGVVISRNYGRFELAIAGIALRAHEVFRLSSAA